MKKYIQLLLKKAKEKNLEAEVFYRQSENTEIFANEREIAKNEFSDSSVMNIRVIYNDKVGYVSTENFDEKLIDSLLDSAKDSAIYSEADDLQFIYEGDKEYSKINHKKTFKSLPESTKIYKTIDNLNDIALAYDKKIQKLTSTAFYSGKGCKIIANTKGLYLEEKDGHSLVYFYVTAKDGNRVKTHLEMEVTRDINSVDLEKLLKKTCKKVLQMLSADQIESGKYDTIIENKAMVSMLETFSLIFSAESVQKDTSALKGKLNEVIANKAVTLVDEPLMPNGIQSTSFDDEGLATFDKNIIEDGVLKTYLYNLKTANKDGVKSTGNAGKSGTFGEVKIRTFNLHFKNGQRSVLNIAKDMDEVIVISSLQGTHSGADPISGDFSLQASGYMLKNGKYVKDVDQIVLSGNYYELLKNMQEFANDLVFPHGSSGSPSCYVGKMSIAGK